MSLAGDHNRAGRLHRGRRSRGERPGRELGPTWREHHWLQPLDWRADGQATSASEGHDAETQESCRAHDSEASADRPGKPPALDLQIQFFAVRQPAEIGAAVSALRAARPEALLVHPHPMFWLERRRIAQLASEVGLPAMYENADFVEVGGLMSYGASPPDIARRAAGYIDRILKGAKPADLHVEQPTKFELVINLKTAKALGLTFPPAVLARADEVIE
jgi:ABC transporter substrate binding protein